MEDIRLGVAEQSSSLKIPEAILPVVTSDSDDVVSSDEDENVVPAPNVDHQNLMVHYLKTTAETQIELLKAVKNLAKDIRSLKKAALSPQQVNQVSQAFDLVNLDAEETVEHDGRVLNNVSSSNVPSVFALAVARELWSDQELRSGCVRKKRDTGRRPLSPTRIALFHKVVSIRCGKGPHVLDLASSAVNQLGLDLKRNIRQREK